MSEHSGNDENIAALLAALIEGDRWLSADACAAYIGGIKRRTFQERIACRPDFPVAAQPLGAMKVWKKSEVDHWVAQQRKKAA